MIETIYSNENGEGNLSNRMQASFKMPKNVRQIGKSGAAKKIYVEDYVMTYIKQLSGGDFSKCKYGVLVGQRIKLDNCRNIFVSGAVEVTNADTSNEIVFSNDTWTAIYEDIKKFFVETEIVGWFIGGPGYLTEDEEKIRKAHIDNFAGQDKILMTFDNIEKEEAFFYYENNRLAKQEGYYIYYEKNEEMQTYMIDRKEPQSSEADYDDRVSRDIRTVIQKNKPEQVESKGITRLVYAAGTLLALIVLVVGAAVLNNYDQMQRMQDTLNYLSQNMEEVQTLFAGDNTSSAAKETQTGEQDTENVESTSTAGENKNDEGSLNVEVVPGEVESLEETSGNQGEEKTTNEETAPEESAGETSQEESASSEAVDTVQEVKEEKATEKVQDKINYYTVQAGDTLAGISFKLYQTYTKVAKIMELNGIENKDIIFVGQKLIVP